MKMNVEFESREELLNFIGMFGTTPIATVANDEKCGQVLVSTETKKEEVKTAAENPKKNKSENKKEEQPKVDDKKEEATKVYAEVTGVDETPTEPPKDAEVTEDTKEPEVTNITKEMVRAICSQAIKAGKSAEVKNIVSKYGASKLPGLKEECYADAYKDVEALL